MTAGPAPSSRADWPRRHTPTAARSRGLGSLLRAQVVAEVKDSARVPEYVIGVIGVPVLLFAMFGLANAGQKLPGGTDVGALVWASMNCYGVVSLAIFTFGVAVAEERGKGWLRRLRATPMPMGVYFAGKIVMAVLFAAAIVALTLTLALTAGGIRFDTGRLGLSVVLILGGGVAFSTMGFAIAFWFRPKAASAIGNLLFLPLSFLSGFFYPLEALPQFLQSLAPWLPTYHFGQLVWNTIAPAQDVEAYGALQPGSMAVDAAWVIGSFVVFGVLTAVGYRRNIGQSAR